MNVGSYAACMWASATAWDMALRDSNDAAEAVAAAPPSDGDAKGAAAAAAAAPRIRPDFRALLDTATNDIDVSRVFFDSESGAARGRIRFDLEGHSFLRPPRGPRRTQMEEFSPAEAMAANASVVVRHCVGVMHHVMSHFGWMNVSSENGERLNPYGTAERIVRLVLGYSGDMERVYASVPSAVNLQQFPVESNEVSFRALILLAHKFARSCSKEDFDKMHDLFTDLRLQLPPEALPSMQMEINYVMRRCALIAESFVDGTSPLKLECHGLYVWLTSRAQKRPQIIGGAREVTAYMLAYQIIDVGFSSHETEMDSTILEAHIQKNGLDVNAVFKRGTKSLLQLAFANVLRAFANRSQSYDLHRQNTLKALEVVLRAGGNINLLDIRRQFWGAGLFAHPLLFKLLVEYGMDLNADALPALTAIKNPGIFRRVTIFDNITNLEEPADLRKRAIALCVLHRMDVTVADMLALEPPPNEGEAVRNFVGFTRVAGMPICLFGPDGLWTQAQEHLKASEAAYCTSLVQRMHAPSVTATTDSGASLFNLLPLLQVIASYAVDLKAISPDYFRRFAFTQHHYERFDRVRESSHLLV